MNSEAGGRSRKTCPWIAFLASFEHSYSTRQVYKFKMTDAIVWTLPQLMPVTRAVFLSELPRKFSRKTGHPSKMLFVVIVFEAQYLDKLLTISVDLNFSRIALYVSNLSALWIMNSVR